MANLHKNQHEKPPPCGSKCLLHFFSKHLIKQIQVMFFCVCCQICFLLFRQPLVTDSSLVTCWVFGAKVDWNIMMQGQEKNTKTHMSQTTCNTAPSNKQTHPKKDKT